MLSSEKDEIVSLIYDWNVAKQYVKRKKEGAILRFFVPGMSREVIICRFQNNILFIKDPGFSTNKKYKNIIAEVLELASQYNVSCVLVQATKLNKKLMQEALLVHSVTNVII